MKNVYLIFIFAFQFSIGSNGQTVLFSENFDDNYTFCFANSYPFDDWNVVDVGPQGTNANTWYINYPENSIGGTGCDTPNTFHSKGALFISYGNNCDSSLYGATFKKGCDNLTSKRVETPVISCSTATTAPILEFDFMANSIHNTDFASVLYSFNGGTDWDTLIQRLNTGRCYRVNSSGFWQHQSITLPPSSVGNSNVKIAFAWTNNDDCVGAYVSVAIDNIKVITSTCDLPITLGKGGLNIPSQLCVDDLFFRTISEPAGAEFSYQWIIDDSVISTSAVISEYLTVGEHTISAYAYSESGECGLLTQTIDVQPSFTASASTSDNDICLNECIDFYASATPSGSCYTYSWSFLNAIPDGSNIQNPTGICFDNPGSSNGIVTVSCNTSVCVATATASLIVNECGHTYVTDIYHNYDAHVCEGETLSFESNAANATSYFWSFPGGTPSTSTDPSPLITYNTNNTGSTPYSFSLIVTNSYNTDTIWSSNAENIFVNPSPIVPILTATSWTGSSLLTVTNSTAIIASGDPITWHYYNSTWNYISTNDNIFTYTATIPTSTLYKVEVINSHLCTSEATITVP